MKTIAHGMKVLPFAFPPRIQSIPPEFVLRASSFVHRPLSLITIYTSYQARIIKGGDFRKALVATLFPVTHQTKKEKAMSRIQFFRNMVKAVRREEGQTLSEYALILVLIAVVAIIAITLLGNQISAVINSIANAL